MEQRERPDRRVTKARRACCPSIKGKADSSRSRPAVLEARSSSAPLETRPPGAATALPARTHLFHLLTRQLAYHSTMEMDGSYSEEMTVTAVSLCVPSSPVRTSARSKLHRPSPGRA